MRKKSLLLFWLLACSFFAKAAAKDQFKRLVADQLSCDFLLKIDAPDYKTVEHLKRITATYLTLPPARRYVFRSCLFEKKELFDAIDQWFDSQFSGYYKASDPEVIKLMGEYDALITNTTDHNQNAVIFIANDDHNQAFQLKSLAGKLVKWRLAAMASHYNIFISSKIKSQIGMANTFIRTSEDPTFKTGFDFVEILAHGNHECIGLDDAYPFGRMEVYAPMQSTLAEWFRHGLRQNAEVFFTSCMLGRKLTGGAMNFLNSFANRYTRPDVSVRGSTKSVMILNEDWTIQDEKIVINHYIEHKNSTETVFKNTIIRSESPTANLAQSESHYKKTELQKEKEADPDAYAGRLKKAVTLLAKVSLLTANNAYLSSLDKKIWVAFPSGNPLFAAGSQKVIRTTPGMLVTKDDSLLVPLKSYSFLLNLLLATTIESGLFGFGLEKYSKETVEEIAKLGNLRIYDRRDPQEKAEKGIRIIFGLQESDQPVHQSLHDISDKLLLETLLINIVSYLNFNLEESEYAWMVAGQYVTREGDRFVPVTLSGHLPQIYAESDEFFSPFLLNPYEVGNTFKEQFKKPALKK